MMGRSIPIWIGVVSLAGKIQVGFSSVAHFVSPLKLNVIGVRAHHGLAPNQWIDRFNERAFRIGVLTPDEFVNPHLLMKESLENVSEKIGNVPSE